jgi:hypothetical protein
LENVEKHVLQDFVSWIRSTKTGYGRNEIICKLGELESKYRKLQANEKLCHEKFVIAFFNLSNGEECVISAPYDSCPDPEIIATGVHSYGAEYAVVEKRYFPAWEQAHQNEDDDYQELEIEDDDLPF